MLTWALRKILEEEQGEEGPSFHKSMLAGLDAVIVLNVLCNGTQDDHFHNLAQNQG